MTTRIIQTQALIGLHTFSHPKHFIFIDIIIVRRIIPALSDSRFYRGEAMAGNLHFLLSSTIFTSATGDGLII